MVTKETSKYWLSNEQLSIGLDISETGCGLREIIHQPSTTSFTFDEEPRSPIWELEFREEAGEHLRLSSLDAGTFDLNVDDSGETKLCWEEIPIHYPDRGDFGSASVEIAVELTEDGRSRWRATVDLNTLNVTLWRFRFPFGSDLCCPGRARTDDRLVHPESWGHYIEDPANADWLPSLYDVYPSLTWPMQFFAFENDGVGLYVGAHDSDARLKGMSVHSTDTREELGFHVDHYPEGMGTENDGLEIQYDVVLSVYEGDWYDASQIYRDWATDEPTWTNEPVTEREETPEWLKEVALWWAPGFAEVVPWSEEREFGTAGIRATLPLLEAWNERFDVPTGIHWFNWHQVPYDAAYPDFLPAREGFADAVDTASDLGYYNMVHANARFADRNSDAWDEYNLKAAAAKRASPRYQPAADTRYVETYETTAQLVSPICAATDSWQRNVADFTHDIVDGLGVDAVYLDQISSPNPPLCFDRTHDHPMGGGSYAIDGYRELLRDLHNSLSAAGDETALTSESNAEPYMDHVDTHLMWSQQDPEAVPMFPSIYGEYSLTYAREFFEADVREDELRFTSKLAHLFTFGAQLGWIDRPVARALLEDRYAPIAEYFAEMAALVYEAREFVLMGRRLRTPEFRTATPDQPVMWDNQHGRCIETDLAPVLASVWAHPTRDTTAVALTNWTRKSCAGSFDLSEAELPSRPSIIEPIVEKGSPPVELTDELSLRLTVPQLSTVILKTEE